MSHGEEADPINDELVHDRDDRVDVIAKLQANGSITAQSVT